MLKEFTSMTEQILYVWVPWEVEANERFDGQRFNEGTCVKGKGEEALL